MSLFKVGVVARNTKDEQRVSPSAEVLVDTGSELTWLPRDLLLGIGVTASIGQLLMTKAFTAGDPAKVSVVGLSQVVFALMIDVWEDQALPNDMTLLGMALIMAPTAWVMRKSG